MVKIVIGGQIDREEIRAMAQAHSGGKCEIEAMSDLDAAGAVKAGSADYYLGACNTGGGGALAMAMALLGRSLCETLSMPGKILEEEEIRAAVRNGKKAFGFTAQHKDRIVPVLMDEITKNL